MDEEAAGWASGSSVGYCVTAVYCQRRNGVKVKNKDLKDKLIQKAV